jgi:Rrf2 family transcriptional regulator, nitric oxide-sensitive transcriptional repressor
MRLAEYTDYALRVLMYCASNPGRLVTIPEISEAYGLSRNHLMKIVHDLGRQGLLETTRGRGGGMRLLKPAAQIRIGEVIRATETDFRLVECFDESSNACTLTPTCRMRSLLNSALAAYFRELDGATLADLVGPPARARRGDGVIPIQPVAAARPAKSAPRTRA